MNTIQESVKSGNTKEIVKGCTYTFIINAMLLLIYAVILTTTGISENTIYATIIVINSIGIIVGSSFVGMKIRKNGIVNGLLVGMIYFVILYIISSVFITGFGMNIMSIVAIAIDIIAGIFGGILGVNIKKNS